MLVLLLSFIILPIYEIKVVNASKSFITQQEINYSFIDPELLNSQNNHLQHFDINVIHNGETFEGYNLFILIQENVTGEKRVKRNILLITDMEGKILIECDLGISAMHSMPVKFINATTLLFYSPKLRSTVLWNLQNNKTVKMNFSGHHEFEYNPINNTIFTLVFHTEQINGSSYTFDYIREYDKSALIWSLDTHDFISHKQMCPFGDMMSGGSVDVVHGNTVFFDSEENIIYFNSRNVNTFYKIDHKTGKVLWGLGEFGNFTLFDQKGIQKKSLFYHAHAVEKVDDNTFILFDNDMHNKSNNQNKRSRLVEITIDEETMTANETWVWKPPINYFSVILGDADRLPNGNRLGTFGDARAHENNIGGRIVEIDEKGNIVWEMNFQNNERFWYYVYRAERFCFGPILDPITTCIESTENYTEVEWRAEAWYNFRTKQRFTEPYTLYLDNQSIHHGIHTFDKFWQPTIISENLGPLRLGTHTITVEFNGIFAGYNVHNNLIIGACPSINNEPTDDRGLAVAFILLLISGGIATIGLMVFLYRKR